MGRDFSYIAAIKAKKIRPPHIHEVEARKLHLDLGYDSIFKFLTSHHGYSEDAAYARMQGARLLAQIPALQEKLEQGSLSLTQLSKV